MLELAAATGAAAVAFVATSLDNLILLVGFFAEESYPRRKVVAGYVAAVLVVGLVAFGVSAAAHRAPHEFLGYLGIIPIGLGVHHAVALVSARRTAGGGGSGEGLARPEKSVAPHSATRGVAVSVALVMLAAGGDSLATFMALFADTRADLAIPVLLAIGGTALIWSGLAAWLVSHPRIVRIVRRFGPYFLPILLIAIGLFILADTPSDVDLPPIGQPH
jgi:cadmium resistance protein CadD (predicted permease)